MIIEPLDNSMNGREESVRVLEISEKYLDSIVNLHKIATASMVQNIIMQKIEKIDEEYQGVVAKIVSDSVMEYLRTIGGENEHG